MRVKVSSCFLCFAYGQQPSKVIPNDHILPLHSTTNIIVWMNFKRKKSLLALKVHAVFFLLKPHTTLYVPCTRRNFHKRNIFGFQTPLLVASHPSVDDCHQGTNICLGSKYTHKICPARCPISIGRFSKECLTQKTIETLGLAIKISNLSCCG